MDVCMVGQAPEFLAVFCKLWGPCCSEPSSVVEAPKTDRRCRSGEQVDILGVGRLVVVEKGDPVPIGKEVEPEAEFGATWAIQGNEIQERWDGRSDGRQVGDKGSPLWDDA